MKEIILRSAAEKVLSRIKAMTDEELKSALESCSEGPIGYALSASQSYVPNCYTQQVVSFYLNSKLLPKDVSLSGDNIPLVNNSGEIYDAANDALYALAA
jgi:hypothetical protein